MKGLFFQVSRKDAKAQRLTQAWECLLLIAIGWSFAACYFLPPDEHGCDTDCCRWFGEAICSQWIIGRMEIVIETMEIHGAALRPQGCAVFSMVISPTGVHARSTESKKAHTANASICVASVANKNRQ